MRSDDMQEYNGGFMLLMIEWYGEDESKEDGI